MEDWSQRWGLSTGTARSTYDAADLTPVDAVPGIQLVRQGGVQGAPFKYVVCRVAGGGASAGKDALSPKLPDPHLLMSRRPTSASLGSRGGQTLVESSPRGSSSAGEEGFVVSILATASAAAAAAADFLQAWVNCQPFRRAAPDLFCFGMGEGGGGRQGGGG